MYSIGDDICGKEKWKVPIDGFLTELEPTIYWEKSKNEYRNIELHIADNIGLIRSKAKAVHDGGLVPRKTDKKIYSYY